MQSLSLALRAGGERLHALEEGDGRWVIALSFGMVSALSLPLGAVLGILMSPVNPFIVANIIAFGAGCLIFAVTVELYGDQLMHLHRSEYEGTSEIIICLCAAIVGAILYIILNRTVESLEEAKEGETEEHTPRDAGQVESGRSAESDPLVKRTTTSSQRWSKVRHAVKFTKMKVDVKLRHGTAGGEGNARTLALGMLAGILADGIPEAVLIGFLASEGHLSVMFVVSLFIANFPESFSSASLMSQGDAFTYTQIIGMWTVPMVMTGALAGLACWAIPPWAHATLTVRILAAVIEGLAGGMMMTMISSVMLPQAFNMAKDNPVWSPFRPALKPGEKDEHHGGDVPGVFCVCGFLCAVSLKVLGGALGQGH